MKKAYNKELKRLGERIKEIRAKKTLTQQQLSDLCDVDIRTIQRIESGEHGTGLHILYAIADAFDINASKLLED
jgi:transcriptional regulator with XRE-family HTH domain